MSLNPPQKKRKPYSHFSCRFSRSCVPRSRNCISCIPKCPLHVYQLRPQLSAPNMTSCVPRLVRNCISCIEDMGVYKMSNSWKVLTILLYFTLHTIVCWHTELLNDNDSVQLLYRLTVWCLNSIKKYLFREEDRHIVFLKSPISSYCYDLMTTLSVYGKSFNHLTLNGHYMGCTAQLTSRCCILYIYSTNIRTEHFKHAA